MIYYCVPYNTDKNLAQAYNSFMEIIPNDDDYACFVDGDTIFTTSEYGYTIQSAVQAHPEVGCFTCYTNRVNNKLQVIQDIDFDSNDVIYHRNIGKTLQTIFGESCIDFTSPYFDKGRPKYMSGCLIVLQKRLWKKIDKFKDLSSMLGVDNKLHEDIIRIGEKIYLMQGVYIYHWYRWPDIKNISHLI
jgi:GT2 family glycosyltransferase